VAKAEHALSKEGEPEHALSKEGEPVAKKKKSNQTNAARQKWRCCRWGQTQAYKIGQHTNQTLPHKLAVAKLMAQTCPRFNTAIDGWEYFVPDGGATKSDSKSANRSGSRKAGGVVHKRSNRPSQ
jgi:hypothetical protein